MKVVILAAAENDLGEIGDAIATDNPLRASSFIKELREKALSIGPLPRGFPIVPKLAHLEIRRRNHGNYAILYRIEIDYILVLRIVHAKRNYETFLRGE